MGDEKRSGAQADRRGGMQAEKSRTRREQILDAAFNTFARRGYRDTAMDEIAAAAETSKGGVYFHFATKEAIFRELMRSTADRLAAKVDRAVATETDPIAKADAALRTVFATFAGHRNLDTTQQYIHLSARELADKLARGMAEIHAWRVMQLAETLREPK